MFVANLSLYRKMTKSRSENLTNVLLPLLPDKGIILDFGCGNGYMAETILNKISALEITGVDVIKDQNLDESILKNPRFTFQIIIPDKPLRSEEHTSELQS